MIAPQTFFSTAYQKFTRLYHTTVVEEEEETHVPEKVIRCVWNDKMFNTENLRTTGGQALEVVFPGYWNFGSGPDFKSAAIKVDGQLLEGDVELHVYGIDWKAHGHSKNNDYDNVVLHVFLWKGRGKTDPRQDNLSRPHIHELELKSYLRKGVLKLNEELDFDSYPLLNQFNYGLCHRPLSRLSGEKFLTLLNNAGDARIQTKMDRFHDRIITKGYEQTFYEGVAEAMGYPSNKTPFRTLAESVTLEELRRIVPAEAEEGERIQIFQALMFGISGLIDFSAAQSNAPDDDTRKYFAALQAIWEQHRAEFDDREMNPKDWKFGRMRPANFPYRRISALAHLISRHWQEGLFNDCLKTLTSLANNEGTDREQAASVRACYQFFCLDARDYWALHYTPNGKQLKQNQSLIGKDRSREIVINILIPTGLIYARASKSTSLEGALARLYETRKPPADNKWIRFMKRYLLGNLDPMLKSLTSDRQTQGLMQVYQDFCTKNENNCLRCRFPQVVERYFS